MSNATKSVTAADLPSDIVRYKVHQSSNLNVFTTDVTCALCQIVPEMYMLVKGRTLDVNGFRLQETETKSQRRDEDGNIKGGGQGEEDCQVPRRTRALGRPPDPPPISQDNYDGIQGRGSAVTDLAEWTSKKLVRIYRCRW